MKTYRLNFKENNTLINSALFKVHNDWATISHGREKWECAVEEAREFYRDLKSYGYEETKILAAKRIKKEPKMKSQPKKEIAWCEDCDDNAEWCECALYNHCVDTYDAVHGIRSPKEIKANTILNSWLRDFCQHHFKHTNLDLISDMIDDLADLYYKGYTVGQASNEVHCW